MSLETILDKLKNNKSEDQNQQIIDKLSDISDKLSDKPKFRESVKESIKEKANDWFNEGVGIKGERYEGKIKAHHIATFGLVKGLTALSSVFEEIPILDKGIDLIKDIQNKHNEKLTGVLSHSSKKGKSNIFSQAKKSEILQSRLDQGQNPIIAELKQVNNKLDQLLHLIGAKSQGEDILTPEEKKKGLVEGKIKKKKKGILGKIVKFIGGFVEDIGAVAMGAVTGLLVPAIEIIVTAIGSFLLGGLINKIPKLFGGHKISTYLANFLYGTVQDVKKGAVATFNFFKNLGSNIKKGVNVLGNVIKKVGIAYYNMFKGLVNIGFNIIGDVFGKKVENNLKKSIYGFFTNFKSNLKKGIEILGSNIKKGAKDTYNFFTHFGSNIKKGVNVLGNVFKDIKNVFSDVIKNLINGILNILKKIPGANAVVNTIKKAYGFVKKEVTGGGSKSSNSNSYLNAYSPTTSIGTALPPVFFVPDAFNRTKTSSSNIKLAQEMQESGGSQFAKSGVGARGIFQFMPSTWKWLWTDGSLWKKYGTKKQYEYFVSQGGKIPNIYDEKAQTMANDVYMKSLKGQFGGSTRWSLAAYNAGSRNMGKLYKKYHGNFNAAYSSMPGQTRDYVARIEGMANSYQNKLGIHGYSAATNKNLINSGLLNNKKSIVNKKNLDNISLTGYGLSKTSPVVNNVNYNNVVNSNTSGNNIPSTLTLVSSQYKYNSVKYSGVYPE